MNLEWSLGANVGAVAAATALLVVGFGLFNVLRGHPFLTRPGRVGVVELSVFVLLLSVLPLILLVSTLVRVFFTTLGALLVDVGVIREWTGEEPQDLLRIPLSGQVVVTRQLLRAAFGIAVFSGL